MYKVCRVTLGGKIIKDGSADTLAGALINLGRNLIFWKEDNPDSFLHVSGTCALEGKSKMQVSQYVIGHTVLDDPLGSAKVWLTRE
jgi:hypothetical protein